MQHEMSGDAAALPSRTSFRASPESSAVTGFRLERRPDGRLWLTRAGEAIAIDIVRCFPWTEPHRFLSLRDAQGNELAFVAEVRELDIESQRALALGLARSGFVLEVVAVLAVEEDFELRSFVVRTRHGERRFQTALDAWPRLLEDGGLVLEDVYGDLYKVPHPNGLDPRSLELMRPFID